MAALKARDVEQYLTRPTPFYQTYLIYGPDIGGVADAARTLALASGADMSDPLTTVKLTADAVASDPALVADEAYAVSMFGGHRVVWIQGSTNRNIVTALQGLIDQPADDCTLIIEGGDLKKSSPLRSRIEKASNALTVPCYPDSARDIASLVDEAFAKTSQRIEPDAKEWLLNAFGDDRLATKSELDKLALYAYGSESIDLADIETLFGDLGASDLNALADATLTGNTEASDRLVRRLIARGQNVQAMIGAVQRHVQMLHALAQSMRASGQTIAKVIGGSRPPVHFSRRASFEAALKAWSSQGLVDVLSRLEKVSLESRSKPELAEQLFRTALLAVSLQAARQRR
ncbi:MAG: DNA polymerase III subunit delta [Ahrensia sp.]|nr:DNA polymerase III subunit delta [Ahrensia sp.]